MSKAGWRELHLENPSATVRTQIFNKKRSHLLWLLTKGMENCRKPFSNAAGYIRIMCNYVIEWPHSSLASSLLLTVVKRSEKRRQARITNDHPSESKPRPTMLNIWDSTSRESLRRYYCCSQTNIVYDNIACYRCLLREIN